MGPGGVTPRAAIRLATPKSKSVILGAQSASGGREPPDAPAPSGLDGLRSRWTTPRSWACLRAGARRRARATASCHGRRPRCSSTVCSVGPSTYSITRNGRPSSTPKLYKRTMPGCWSWAMARISRRKRVPTSVSPATSADRTLTATTGGWPSGGGSARASQTLAMLPRPSSHSRTHGPNCLPIMGCRRRKGKSRATSGPAA